jgi:hypothetical protein
MMAGKEWELFLLSIHTGRGARRFNGFESVCFAAAVVDSDACAFLRKNAKRLPSDGHGGFFHDYACMVFDASSRTYSWYAEDASTHRKRINLCVCQDHPVDPRHLNTCASYAARHCQYYKDSGGQSQWGPTRELFPKAQQQVPGITKFFTAAKGKKNALTGCKVSLAGHNNAIATKQASPKRKLEAVEQQSTKKLKISASCRHAGCTEPAIFVDPASDNEAFHIDSFCRLHTAVHFITRRQLELARAKRARQKEQSELGARVSEKQPIPVKRAKRATEKEHAAAESELADGVASTTHTAVKRKRSFCEHNRERRLCKQCGGSGICEHNRSRSSCKQCGGSSVCEHNRQRSTCKPCGGASICEHNRIRRLCKQCGGSGICEHNRRRSSCKPCGGASICEHNRIRSQCQLCGGSSFCEHNRSRSSCKQCGGSSVCEHNRQRRLCKQCGGSGICEHNRQRSSCKQCGGSSFCEHNRERRLCKQCGGSGICEHNRSRSTCKPCGGSSVCEHNRQRSTCKPCGGASICEHNRIRRLCKQCGGSGICEHKRIRSSCKLCG